MDRDEVKASMAAKAAQLADIVRRTDVDGRVSPVGLTEAEVRANTLRTALTQAVDAGDHDAAGILAEALAKSAAAEGRPAGAAGTVPPGSSSDQGVRPGPPAPPSLAEALAAAEAAGDTASSMRVKAAMHDLNRRRTEHDNAKGIIR